MSGRARGPLIAAVTALVVLVGSMAGTQLLPEGRGRATGPTWRANATRTIAFSALCDTSIGEPGSDVSAAEVELVDRYRDDLVDATTGCGVGSPQVFGEAAYQVAVEDLGVVVVFASADGVVRLTPAEAWSYQEVVGDGSSLEAAAALVGYPTTVADTVEDAAATPSVGLSHGLLLGGRRDTVSFWMDGVVHDLWRANDNDLVDRIGLPLSNPYLRDGGVRQDFERGYLSLPITELTRAAFDELEPGDIEVRVAEASDDPLEAFEGQEGIFRQPTGTMWWFDSDGHRHWIRNEETLRCLGEDRMLIDDIDGPTLAVVPLGHAATCTMAVEE